MTSALLRYSNALQIHYPLAYHISCSNESFFSKTNHLSMIMCHLRDVLDNHSLRAKDNGCACHPCIQPIPIVTAPRMVIEIRVPLTWWTSYEDRDFAKLLTQAALSIRQWGIQFSIDKGLDPAVSTLALSKFCENASVARLSSSIARDTWRPRLASGSGLAYSDCHSPKPNRIYRPN